MRLKNLLNSVENIQKKAHKYKIIDFEPFNVMSVTIHKFIQSFISQNTLIASPLQLNGS